MPVAELNLVIAMAAGCFGAWLFASAAIYKVSDFMHFSATLGAYKLAPQAFTTWFAAFIVALEILAAVTLLLVCLMPMVAPVFVSHLDVQAGWLSLRLLALLAPLLLLGYAAAMAVNLMRGRRSIDCGCGGTPMPLSKALVVRNLLLSAFLLYALMIVPTAGGVGGAALMVDVWLLLLVLGFSLVLGFVYLIVNQLLANRALHERLWVHQ